MNFIREGDDSLQNHIPPLKAFEAVGQIPTLKEPMLLGDFVLWLEQRPDEGGRTTALIRPWMQIDCEPQELTPAPIDLKTRIHGYGGGAFTASKQGKLIVICWVNACNGCLWLQHWIENDKNTINRFNYLKALKEPICLSKKEKFYLAGGLIDRKRNRWLGVMEKNNQDYIVQFILNKEFKDPKILYQAKDFIGYLTLSPNSNYLSWIEWQAPYMPWDSSQLLIAQFDERGTIVNSKIVLGEMGQQNKQVSVFQPLWLSSGEIIASEDQTGWWNVILGSLNSPLDETKWSRLWPMDAETAMPQWVLGMSTLAVSGEKIVVAVCRQGSWQLCLLTKEGLVDLIDQPFNDLSGLYAQEGRVLAIAGDFSHKLGLLELDLHTQNWEYSYPIEFSISNEQFSKPRAFLFKGFKDQITHSWYYPPIHPEKECSPLLVKSHSGPTSMARTSLDLEIQFWTSRGWGVVDVNYGGSSGFGRIYRERIESFWGEVDVIDCISAANALVEAGIANKKYIAIEGSSSGGFTALGCLASSDIFKVAACKYPVSDLISMSQLTHRFEANYLDYLIGKPELCSRYYAERSPINNSNKIKSPVIFFQGMKDKVVNPDQTKNIYKSLLTNNIPVELHNFDNEGHGFKDGITKVKVLELTEEFFRKYLKI